MNKNWTCPFCNRAQTVTSAQVALQGVGLPMEGGKFGHVGAYIEAITCANNACKEVSLTTYFVRLDQDAKSVNQYHRNQFVDTIKERIETFQLRPNSLAKPQPDFIPAPLREDYFEACLIRDLSPKASATLSRRCIQGMIRDFCAISKARLIDEVQELRKRVDAGSAPAGVNPEDVDAIDAVRGIGNIGAHMEKDINLIVEVAPGEAQALIELIELLFEEWYVARHDRQARVARVKAIAADKKAVIADARAQAAEVK